MSELPEQVREAVLAAIASGVVGVEKGFNPNTRAMQPRKPRTALESGQRKYDAALGPAEAAHARSARLTAVVDRRGGATSGNRHLFPRLHEALHQARAAGEAATGKMLNAAHSVRTARKMKGVPYGNPSAKPYPGTKPPKRGNLPAVSRPGYGSGSWTRKMRKGIGEDCAED